MSEYLIRNCQLYRPFHPTNYKHFQVRIKDGNIVAIEENGHNPGNAKIFDAKDRTLAASYKDSHIHLLRYALMKEERDLRSISTWTHLQEELKDEHERNVLQHNEWLVGRGLRDNRYKDRDKLLTAKDLDSLNIKHPIFLLHQDGHECLLNSKAIEIVKQNGTLQKEHNIFIEKDADGNWTGRFKETAVHFIKMHFRNKSLKQAKSALKEVIPYVAESGITHVDSDDLNYVGDYDKVWQAYTELDEELGLSFAAYLHHYVYNIDEMKHYLNNNKFRSGEGKGNVRVGAFKIFVDGTFRLGTAALSLPFEDKKSCGNLIYEEAELAEMVKLAEQNKMQVTMHCIGDRAVETAAKAIMNANPREHNPLRHRIIHMISTRYDLLDFIAKQKIPVEMQYGFIPAGWASYERHLGEDRPKLALAGQSLIDKKIIFTSSSDAPIGALNPAEHIHAAVNRTDRFGKPDGGWQPQERMTIDEAFNSYCATPAYLNHSAKETGRLIPGYQADLMLLEAHPYEVDSSRLDQIKVDNLWYKGKMVYNRYV